MKFAIPESLTSDDILAARKKMGLTQADFAKLMGCSKPTVERWEKSDKEITGPVVLALYLLLRDEASFNRYIVPQKELPVRLWYMYKKQPCTMIDVDEMRRIVKIRNYTDNIMFRAFGVNETPDYQDFQEFLAGRCFPESRDKMKLVLRDLNLPFYDPMLIIEKTEGKMAEDDFWIKIEH